MKVFISWSGEFSRKVAERLSIWIPTIIQSVDVFYSPDDIAKGENWGNRLSDELEQSNFGIVCLTPENVTAPWIHFEAGALSKAANSRVSAIMLGITPSDIKGPLARLQNTTFNRDEFFRLLQSINNSSDKPLKQEILASAFNNSWGCLISDINPIIEDYTSRTPAPKSEKDKHEDRDSDAIQEILRIVRNLDNSRNPSASISASADSLSLNNWTKHLESVILLGPKDHLISAAPIANKYSPFPPIIGITTDGLPKCTVKIPTEQLSAFKDELHNSVPEVHITTT